MMERDHLIQEMKGKMNRVEDDVFEEFCRQIGMQNIRQYEERELRSQQERAKKRLEFENQKNRITNQLEFERMKDTKSKFFTTFRHKEILALIKTNLTQKHCIKSNLHRYEYVGEYGDRVLLNTCRIFWLLDEKH